MSKAFTKEDDGPGNLRLDDLPQCPHPNYVTPAGLAALQDRLRARTRELESRRAGNDGMDDQIAIAIAERDIRYLQARLASAIPVDPAEQEPGIVAFGAEVEVVDECDRRHTFRIVGEDEADPARGLITPFSPLAVALAGAAVGDTVEWRKPGAVSDLEITAIRFA